MGFWGNIKAAFQADTVSHTPAVDSRPAIAVNAEHEKAEALAKYARTKATATAAGQTVKGYNAGYIGAEETKAALAALADPVPDLKLVKSPNGMDLALSDGRLVDYKTLALRRWSIFGFRVVGMSYFEDPEKPFRFSLRQKVGLQREPENEFDPNAVAITIGKSSRKVGYVNKQRAKWVASILDGGSELSGIVIQTKTGIPRVLIAPPETLAALTQDW